nr:DUF3159 domain-containing protein [Tissierella sp.]
MPKIFKVIKEEIKTVYSGNTLDTVFPSIIFVIVQSKTSLINAIIFAVSIALILALYRFFKGQKSIYAFGGVLGVALAGGYSYYMGNAASYFLSKLLSTGFLAGLSFISLLIGRPIAAYLSHLSRGWPIEWFWHKKVKPAYNEVTLAWGVLFSLRLLILFIAYRDENVSALLWLSTLLGTPSTIIILILTFLYGTFRLKNLKGPGVEEFIAKKDPPWEGQTRGF